MRRIAKLALVNLLVLLGLLVCTNVASGLYLKYERVLSAALGSEPTRGHSLLPNYADNREGAAQIFREIEDLETQYRAYVGWSRRAFVGETTNVNASGDRIHRAPDGLTSESPIARFFGGSTMWGTGADDNGTIPAIFNELNPQYRVFNHGESGFNSRQNIAHLANLYADGERADLVVLYNGNNHYTSVCYQAAEITHAREEQISHFVQQGSHIHGSILRQVFLEYTLRLFRGAGDEDRDKRPDAVSKHETAARAEECANSLLRFWKLAHGLVSSQNGRFMALLQPVAEYGRARVDHLESGIDERRRKKASFRHMFYD